jgi:cell division protein FtsB
MTMIDEPRVDNAEDTSAGRRRRWYRASAWFGLVALVLIGVGALTVLPMRAWFNQRKQIADAERRLTALQVENDRLAGRLASLQEPDQIAQVARGEFNLVRPNEASYAMLPAPLPSLSTLPAEWPYTVITQLTSHRG